MLAVLLVLWLFSSLGPGIKPTDASPTAVVNVDPPLIEYYSNAVGEEFTVGLKIINVTNLYGFDIRFRWNTTFLDYVNHSVRIPRDTYTEGVLWDPVLDVKNEVNATIGEYWIAYSSMHPAPSFNGSGTAFTMTFRVKYHPEDPEPTANITLELYSTDLVAKDTSAIAHTREHGTVILHTIVITTRMYIDPSTMVSNVSSVYQSRPTTQAISPALAAYVTDPANAYDGDNATYASILTNADGVIDFKVFTTFGPLDDNVAQVDYKIRYQALRVAGGDDRFIISQRVAPSLAWATLRDWTTSDIEVPLDTYVWSYGSEPNDGLWSWTDVSNVFIRFQSDLVSTAESREIRIYEVWATVYDKPFTLKLRAEGVTDLFSWGAKVSWNPTIIDLTSAFKGGFLTGPEGTIFTGTVNHTAGYADLSEEISGPYEGVSGSGILAKITFKVIKEGKTNITLSQTSFKNSFLEPIDHSSEDGSFNTPAYHDVAITDVTPDKNEIYQEQTLSINVTVKNKGTYNESFTVYCYANTTLIGSQSVTNLTGGTETMLTFTWDTSGYTRGNYVLNATTSMITGDYDPDNNTNTYSVVRLKLLGDIDDNGIVNVTDLAELGNAYGSTGGPPPSANWNPNADLNGDNVVNELDLSALSRNYGKTA